MTAFVSSVGEYCYKRIPFDVCNAPWLFTEMTHEKLGHIPDSINYLDDLSVLSITWGIVLSLESVLATL